ncbi:MAG: RadC family protein [Alphaproteobacteria bacterium]
MTESPHYLGHRHRLKERILKSGRESVPDYELLEAALFLSQPRRDTKPLAKELLKKFSSLNDVFLASPEELMSVKGMGNSSISTLKLIFNIAQRLGQTTLQKRFSVTNMENLARYCRLRLQDPKVEQFHVFFLDGHHQIITEQVLQVGTVDQTVVYPREVIKKALEVGATWLILSHNHPSGNCTPSSADIELTRHIMEAGEKLGIGVYDHLVISAISHVSMRESNYLPHI